MEQESPRSLPTVRVPGHALYQRDEKQLPARCRCGAVSDGPIPTVRGRREWQRMHIRKVLASTPTGSADSSVVTAEAQITLRQLDHWSRQGYLRSKQQFEGKSGSVRRWSARERRIAIVMGRLTRAGLSVETAALVARNHVEHPTLSGAYRLEVGIEVSILDFVS